MPFHITVLDARQLPYDPPLHLEIIADGQPLARARTDGAGRAEFAVDLQTATTLAIRLVTVDPPQDDGSGQPG